ncbi:MAG TPA: Ig-like domain-containing protein, partial [Vicinamibacterales bacterium]|nr:Ig-like domain-containing protein [Vicinamibacterales bacterium]
AFGDSGVGSTEQRRLAARMAADTFDLAIHTGDVTYGSSSTSGAGTHQTLNDWFFEIYKDWLRRRPFFPSIGNHDNEIAYARPYRQVFVLPPDAVSSGYADHAERFYSFDFGPAHFVALDTELAFQDSARRAAQLAWLEADLANTAQPWRIVYFHRPPFSSSTGHGSNLTVRRAFVPLFERYGVQLVISGHDHNYERSTPWRQTSGGKPVTYVVTGGGGAKLYGVGQSAWTVRSLSAHHYVRANVTDCALYLVAVGLDGQKLDGMTLDRCAQERDARAPSVSIGSPASGASVRGVVTVAVSASDDQKVEKVDLRIGGSLVAIDATTPYSFAWDTRTAANGSRQIEARAYDIAGRVSSASRTVTVAN